MGTLSIGHWLLILSLVLLYFGVFYGTYRFAKRIPPADKSAEGPAGVGGWLLFLVVSLMFLRPMLGAGGINSDFMSAEAQDPGLRTMEAWSIAKAATWSSFLVVCCLSFYAGLGLARGRDVSVVKRAKMLIWVTGPAAFLVMNGIVPWAAFGKFEVEPLTFGGSVVGATIWSSYLSTSKRVRATYAPDPRQRPAGSGGTTPSGPSPLHLHQA